MFSLDIRCFAGQLDATQLDPKYMGRNLANICGTAMVFFLFWPTNMIRPKPPNCEFKHTPEKKKKNNLGHHTCARCDFAVVATRAIKCLKLLLAAVPMNPAPL